MSTLISLGMKQADGSYKNYTVSINDETNQWGQNVSMWEEQTKEEREAKANRTYVGNGKVVWTDGNVVKAEPKVETETAENDLPF
jgi:hypothetical protein